MFFNRKTKYFSQYTKIIYSLKKPDYMILNKINPIHFFVFIVSLLYLSSCSSPKEVAYFQNAKSFETVVDTDTFVPRFKVDDNISIFVSTLDPEASLPFNLIRPIGTAGGEVVNYFVDIDGYIDFPVLGKIKLLGLTIDEAKELIKGRLEEGYLKDPVVNIQILNFKVSVLGEVNSPGTFVINGERISVLQALAQAGDLTIKGRRDNILVVRDFNGSKTYTRIDITNKEVFNSPVYYLTQNDIIYVEPNHSAATRYFGDSRIGTILSISTFALGIIILVTN